MLSAFACHTCYLADSAGPDPIFISHEYLLDSRFQNYSLGVTMSLRTGNTWQISVFPMEFIQSLILPTYPCVYKSIYNLTVIMVL